jgi:tripartite-type tricarboxylate transporter receptor subunit TctC
MWRSAGLSVVFVVAAAGKSSTTGRARAATAVLAMPDVKERLARLGAEPTPQAPDEFTQFVRDEIARWAKVVRASGATVD